jgi:dihydrofolate reductase
MTKLTVDISMSLDGFIAGPDPSLDQPLGEGGDRLHEWALGLKAWRERHGLSGGDTNPNDGVMEEALANTGATIMGRRMYSGGAGSWQDDPRSDGWWGDEPPFRQPVFILTHHAREPVTKEGGTTFNFVTDGIEAALDQARAAAGDKNVLVAGGADAVQQYLKAGLLDELQIHLIPVFLGSGVRLFDGLGTDQIQLEGIRVIESPGVTHIKFRVVK